MKKISDNIILIDKPSGITSFDCIRKLRGVLGIKKMGHAGTLDPLATGLMVIGVGNEGTKELNNFKGLEKSYEVTTLLGKRTTTGDIEGEVVEEKKVVDIDKKEAQKAVERLIGEKKLPVPLYSAVKKDGKPLYWYARKGLLVETPIKTMVVKEAFFEDLHKKNDDHFIKFFIRVSSGTYVRSLVEEMGGYLGVPATVYALRRVAVGDISIEKASLLDEVKKNF